MSLIKTSFMSLIVTISKMLSALVINKAIAIYIGPSGLALVGQFQNFIQLSMTIGQGGMNAGLTKYSAEFKNEEDQLISLFTTAFKLSCISSITIGFILIIFSSFFSELILNNSDFSYVFMVFGFTLMLFVFNTLLLAILNGLKETKFWFKINIIQSFYGLIFTSLFIVIWGIDGALIAMVTNQSIVFFVLLWMLKDHTLVKLKNFTNVYNQEKAKSLAKYGGMAIISALMVPTSHIIVRNYISDNIGITEAGYWQGLWYISSMYLMVLTSTLSVYYLPRLSELTNKKDIGNELKVGLATFVPIAAIMAITIYFLRDVIVLVLFSNEFTQMTELFTWQLVGDVIKITSWFFGYLMLAKARVKSFIFTEVFFTMLFVILSILFIDEYGLVGITYAYVINYLLYLITSFLLMKNEFT
jgi:O-antigen/teichoic acid export membrane protein